jgi:hypothetical protein
MTQYAPVTAKPPSGEGSPPAKTRRRKWLLLGLALTCCCGGPLLWLPFVAMGGKQVPRFHDGLKVGMSVAEVFGRVDELSLWGLGLSHVYADPEVTALDPKGGPGEGCRASTFLAWTHGSGSPWGRGPNSTLEEAARRFSSCDTIRFRFVANSFSRFEFRLTLKDGRVSAISPLEGHLD